MAPANLIAKASQTIDAPIEKVWEALVSPESIKQYMFGTDATSDFKVGSAITWKGEWQGRAYEDKGVIQEVVPLSRPQYTHFSPLSGAADLPENYHTVTIDLTSTGDGTTVSLSQDNNATEEARQHSEKNWKMMLDGLKKFLES
jgi:uncharacterized protein YndB with AHSA1/START domain